MSSITIEDRVLIRELYELFYLALNEGDADTVRSCFAPGGHVTRYDGDRVSPDGPAETGKKWAADPIGRTYQHHVTTVIVQPDPQGRENWCKVKMYFLVTAVFEPGVTVVRWSCKSVDELQKVDGQWKYWDRYITLNDDSTGPHAHPAEPHHANAGREK